MKASLYNIVIPDYPEEGFAVVYNTLTQAMLKISTDIADSLVAGNIDNIPEEVANVLLSNGVVVENSKQEQKSIEKIVRDIRENMAGFGAEFTILTTYACNFRCIYCFEEDVICDVYMDDSVCDAVVNWIWERCKERQYKWISLVFYGGEPLLNKTVVDRILNYFVGKKIKIIAVILTNGSLLNRVDIARWKDRGLREVRVTLDGPAQTHNNRRFFKGGAPSFDKIIGNLLEIKDLIKISIGVNYDEETLDSIPELFDYLEEIGLKDSISNMVISPVMPRIVRDSNAIGADLNNCGLLFSKNGLFEKGFELNLLARRRGFPVRFPLSRHLCPMISKDGGFTIDPYGKIFRCNSLVGFDEFCVGDLFNGLNDRFYEFLEIEAWRKCPLDCRYLPMCFGGCRFFAFVENADLSSPCCKREFFDRSLPFLVKLEYERRRS